MTKKIMKPDAMSNEDVMRFIIEAGVELSYKAVELARKKNNIRKPNISNAKNQQIKTAISSLKALDSILRNKRLDEFENKLDILLMTIESNNTIESENTLQNINELINELQSLKE